MYSIYKKLTISLNYIPTQMYSINENDMFSNCQKSFSQTLNTHQF